MLCCFTIPQNISYFHGLLDLLQHLIYTVSFSKCFVPPLPASTKYVYSLDLKQTNEIIILPFHILKLSNDFVIEFNKALRIFCILA